MKISNKEAIMLLASKFNEDKKELKSKRCLDSAIEAYGNISSIDEGIKGLVCYPKLINSVIGYGISRSFEQRRRISTISKIVNCDKKEIASDLSDYIKNGCSQSFVADDLTYKAYITDDKLENLLAIWGNGDFRSLDDLKRLRSLVAVLGNMYLSGHESLEGLDNLEFIGGNLYINDVETLDGLNENILISGDIIDLSKKIK